MDSKTFISWIAAVVTVVAAIVIGAVIMDTIINDRPMPCFEREIYVWDDYPNTAHCEVP